MPYNVNSYRESFDEEKAINIRDNQSIDGSNFVSFSLLRVFRQKWMFFVHFAIQLSYSAHRYFVIYRDSSSLCPLHPITMRLFRGLKIQHVQHKFLHQINQKRDLAAINEVGDISREMSANLFKSFNLKFIIGWLNECSKCVYLVSALDSLVSFDIVQSNFPEDVSTFLQFEMTTTKFIELNTWYIFLLIFLFSFLDALRGTTLLHVLNL